jgi:hypothetical protein
VSSSAGASSFFFWAGPAVKDVAVVHSTVLLASGYALISELYQTVHIYIKRETIPGFLFFFPVPGSIDPSPREFSISGVDI